MHGLGGLAGMGDRVACCEVILTFSLNPCLGCFLGTFRPSRCQIRSTALWFAIHPSRLTNAVIRGVSYRSYTTASSTICFVNTFSSSRTAGV